MSRARPPPPAPEDLPRLYLALNRRVERLEGSVRQLLAEQTRDTSLRPTWRDIQELRQEIGRIGKGLDASQSSPT